MDKLAHRPDRWLVAIVALALVARLALLVATSPWQSPRLWDFGYEHGQIAYSLATGNGFSCPYLHCMPYPPSSEQPTAWMPPVYPYFLAGAFSLFGIGSSAAGLVVLLLQISVASIAVVFMYRLADHVFGRNAAQVAGLLFALYPAALHYAAQKIWSSTLVITLMLWLLLRSVRFVEAPSYARAAVLGVVMGIIALTDPIVIGFVPLALLWYWNCVERAVAERAKLTAAIVGALVLVLSPWIIRNCLVFDAFVPVKSNFGHELYLGNNPLALTVKNDDIRRQLRDDRPSTLLTDAEVQYLERADEVEENRLFLRKGLEYISSHPGRFVRLSMERVVRYWTVLDGIENAEEAVTGVACLTVLLLGLASLARPEGRNRNAILMWLAILALPVPFYVTITELRRYRVVVEILLLVPASFTLLAVLRSRRRARAEG